MKSKPLRRGNGVGISAQCLNNLKAKAKSYGCAKQAVKYVNDGMRMVVIAVRNHACKMLMREEVRKACRYLDVRCRERNLARFEIEGTKGVIRILSPFGNDRPGLPQTWQSMMGLHPDLIIEDQLEKTIPNSN